MSLVEALLRPKNWLMTLRPTGPSLVVASASRGSQVMPLVQARLPQRQGMARASGMGGLGRE